MADNRAQLRHELRAWLDALAVPLDPRERANGWDDYKRARYHRIGRALYVRLLDRAPLLPEERRLDLVASLDLRGVCCGRLQAMAEGIDALLLEVL